MSLLHGRAAARFSRLVPVAGVLLAACADPGPADPSPAEGELVVRVYTVGMLPDPEVTVLVDGEAAGTLTLASVAQTAAWSDTPGQDWQIFALPAGTHSLGLADLASNCVAAPDNPGSVLVVSKRTVVKLGVVCSGEEILGSGTLAGAVPVGDWGNMELRLFTADGELVKTDGWALPPGTDPNFSPVVDAIDVSWAPDGNRLATTSWFQQLVGTRSGVIRYLYPPCSGGAFEDPLCGGSEAVAWAPQGNAVASLKLPTSWNSISDAECRIRITDASVEVDPVILSCGTTDRGQTVWYNGDLDWSPGGDRLAVGYPSGLRIVEVASGTITEAAPLAGLAVLAVAWSPAGDEIAAIAQNGGRYDLLVYTPSTGTVRTLSDRIVEVTWGYPTPLAWAPGGKMLIAGARSVVISKSAGVNCEVNMVVPLDQPQAWRPLLPLCAPVSNQAPVASALWRLDLSSR